MSRFLAIPRSAEIGHIPSHGTFLRNRFVPEAVFFSPRAELDKATHCVQEYIHIKRVFGVRAARRIAVSTFERRNA